MDELERIVVAIIFSACVSTLGSVFMVCDTWLKVTRLKEGYNESGHVKIRKNKDT